MRDRAYYRMFRIDKQGRITSPIKHFQWNIGEAYQHQGVVRNAGGGFHACSEPMDAFSHVGNSKAFGVVDVWGKCDPPRRKNEPHTAAFEFMRIIAIYEWTTSAWREMYDEVGPHRSDLNAYLKEKMSIHEWPATSLAAFDRERELKYIRSDPRVKHLRQRDQLIVQPLPVEGADITSTAVQVIKGAGFTPGDTMLVRTENLQRIRGVDAFTVPIHGVIAAL